MLKYIHKYDSDGKMYEKKNSTYNIILRFDRKRAGRGVIKILKWK